MAGSRLTRFARKHHGALQAFGAVCLLAFVVIEGWRLLAG